MLCCYKIIAQVRVTALELLHVSKVHWTDQDVLVTILVMGCLSVICLTVIAWTLSSFSSREDIQDWLSKPASIHAAFIIACI
jgi:hypothetical protein